MHGVQSATHPHLHAAVRDTRRSRATFMCRFCDGTHDVSDIQLPIVMRGLFGVDFTTSTLKRHVVAVCKFVHDVPPLNRWAQRLEKVDPDLGNVTFILDGTVVSYRAPDCEHGHKGKGILFEIAHVLDGSFAAYSGPFRGKRHDARAFGEGMHDPEVMVPGIDPSLVTPFDHPHGQHEIVSADNGYDANLHCMTMWKALDNADISLATRKKRLLIQKFKYVRSRCERKYAELDRHHFLHSCNRSAGMMALLFRLIWNAEILKENASPNNNYADELVTPAQRPRELGDPCTCQWHGMWYAGDPHRRQLNEERQRVAEALWTKEHGRIRMPRPPKNDKDGAPIAHQHMMLQF